MSVEQANGVILTAGQLALLAAVQDRLIPAQDGMPSAGAVGCAATLDGFLRDRPPLRRQLIAALGAVEAAAAARSAEAAEDTAATTHVAFLTLDAAARDATLRDVESDHPEHFELLLRQTYTAYYTNPTVLDALGWQPPQPDGFATPPPFDEALLANVKQRGKVWRDA